MQMRQMLQIDREIAHVHPRRIRRRGRRRAPCELRHDEPGMQDRPQYLLANHMGLIPDLGQLTARQSLDNSAPDFRARDPQTLEWHYCGPAAVSKGMSCRQLTIG